MTQQTTPNVLDGLMPKERFQEMLDISARTEANYRTLRKGPPFYKIGNRIYYKPDEVMAWVEQQRIGNPDHQTNQLRRRR